MKNLWKVALGAAALAVVVSNVFTIAIMSVAWWFLARKRLEAWERALSEAGFSVETKMTGPQYQVVARRGRFVVTAARGFRLDTSPLVNEVTVEAPDLPVALDARQRHGDEPGGVVTGDDWFDERVVVQGPVDEALASLDRAGRLALDRVVRLWGGRLRPGAVVLEKPGGTHAAETLVERVEMRFASRTNSPCTSEPSRKHSPTTRSARVPTAFGSAI